jgi:hypothetical protein
MPNMASKLETILETLVPAMLAFNLSLDAPKGLHATGPLHFQLLVESQTAHAFENIYG